MKEGYREVSYAVGQKSPNSQNKWEAHIRSWEESGMSRSAYCRQHGLHVSSFCAAVKRCVVHPKDTSDEFVEVRPVRKQEKPSGWSFEISFPNGTQLRATECITPAQLASLVELGRR